MSTVQKPIRFDRDLIGRIEAYAAALQDAEPGREVNFAEAVRLLVLRGLGNGRSANERVVVRASYD